MKYACILTLILLSAPAISGDMSCSETIRGSGGVLTEGDGTGRVMKVFGKPDRYVTLTNRFGAAIGERWEYYKTGHNAKTIQISMQGGQVYSICQRLD